MPARKASRPAVVDLPRESSPRATTLHVISDSTGNLAQHMLAAQLTQFPADCVSIRMHGFQKSMPVLDATLELVLAAPGPILHAVVAETMKKRVEAFARRHKLPCFDLTGPLGLFLEEVLDREAHDDPSRLHSVDQIYHRRIAAMEFTLDHDDGLGLDTLHEADIVLCGVSRTSKTPTSILLAQQGFRCANVSLAVDIAPPQQLLALPGTKVVGLTISPDVLVDIRTRRSIQWQLGDTRYNDRDEVRRELMWCRQLFQKQGWKSLDVTHSAVEETAARILDILGLPRIAGG